MGFFKKAFKGIGKAVNLKNVLKVAAVGASFIPVGGSVLGNVLNKVNKVGEIGAKLTGSAPEKQQQLEQQNLIAQQAMFTPPTEQAQQVAQVQQAERQYRTAEMPQAQTFTPTNTPGTTNTGFNLKEFWTKYKTWILAPVLLFVAWKMFFKQKQQRRSYR